MYNKYYYYIYHIYIALFSYIGIRSKVLYNLKSIIMNVKKHNNHLKHNNTNLIKDTVREMGTKRSMGASKNDSI